MKFETESYIEKLKTSEMMELATSENNVLSIRTISPVYLSDSEILFYTSKNSNKYREMKSNENVACSLENYKIKGKVTFLGSIFDEKNKKYADIYKKRQKGAFETSSPGEVMEDNEFLIIKVNNIKTWVLNDQHVPIGLAEKNF